MADDFRGESWRQLLTKKKQSYVQNDWKLPRMLDKFQSLLESSDVDAGWTVCVLQRFSHLKCPRSSQLYHLRGINYTQKLQIQKQTILGSSENNQHN